MMADDITLPVQPTGRVEIAGNSAGILPEHTYVVPTGGSINNFGAPKSTPNKIGSDPLEAHRAVINAAANQTPLSALQDMASEATGMPLNPILKKAA